MEIFEILVIVLVGLLFLRFIGFLKGVPVKKQTALVLAIIIGLAGAYAYNWGGFKDLLTNITPAPAPSVTAGVPTFSVTGSEADDSLLYNASSRTFNMKIRENTTSGNLSLYDYVNAAWKAEAADPTVTFTLTLYREDTDPNAQIGEVGIGVMPTFTVSGDANTYCVIDKTADGKWEIEVTPSGGSARYEYNTALVSGGSSKGFDVKAYFNYSGVNKATDGTVYTATFSGGPPGTDFSLNVTVEPAIT